MCEPGVRVNEIVNIKRCDIQLEKGTILLGVSKTISRPVFLGRFLDEKFPDSTMASFKRICPCSNQIWKIINGMLRALVMKSTNDGRGPHTFRHYVTTDLYFVRGME